MSVEEFKRKPFENHPQYDGSCFSLGVQPEYATGDVLLGSCYRALGLAKASEAEVNLEDIRHLPEWLHSDSAPNTLWEFIFSHALQSPTRLGERSARPLPQVVPLVPTLGHFAGVLGRPRSRWNPGMLALYTLASGVGLEAYPSAAKDLAIALSTTEGEDDEFAVFLERKLSDLPRAQRAEIDDAWLAPKLEWCRVPFRSEPAEPWSPAEALARDLSELLGLKRELTRRQWCALVESVLRIGLATHVLWVCRLTVVAWEHCLNILGGSPAPVPRGLERQLWNGHIGQGAFLDSGQNADPYLRRQVESYTVARLGINLLLNALDDRGAGWGWPASVSEPPGLPAAEQLALFLEHLSAARHRFPKDPKGWIVSQLGGVLDEEASRVSGNAGTPKNLYEFLAYTLQRRRAREPSFKEHDQGYLLAKMSGASTAPWVVRPGPVLLLIMCYATCRSMPGVPATLQHLASHFSFYGVRLSTGDLQEGIVARDLEALGILVDSPDAGGGRLVLSPFAEG